MFFELRTCPSALDRRENRRVERCEGEHWGCGVVGKGEGVAFEV